MLRSSALPLRSAVFICVSPALPGAACTRSRSWCGRCDDEVERPARARVRGVEHVDLVGDLRVRDVAVRDARALVDDVEVDVDRFRRSPSCRHRRRHRHHRRRRACRAPRSSIDVRALSIGHVARRAATLERRVAVCAIAAFALAAWSVEETSSPLQATSEDARRSVEEASEELSAVHHRGADYATMCEQPSRCTFCGSA